MNASLQNELASLLATLRREGRQQSGLDPRLVPPDVATAYKIAHIVAEQLDRKVIGWKIAATNAEMQKALRTDKPIYGRVFEPMIMPSPACVQHANLCNPIPEVEYQVVMGLDLPPRSEPYEEKEVTDAVSTLHPGIELAECRFAHDDVFPPLTAILADGAGNGALVHGLAIPDWQNRDIADQEVLLYSNGKLRRKGTAAAALIHPIVPLTWLANELSRTGIGLKAGQMISTGTLTGMLKPKPGETFTADFGRLGTVTATYT